MSIGFAIGAVVGLWLGWLLFSTEDEEYIVLDPWDDE